jgi:hypothetical protein
MEDYQRCTQAQKVYVDLIKPLEKGKIVEKKRRAISYLYIERREGKKVKTLYLGKKGVFDVRKIEKEIENRKIYENKLRELKMEQAERSRVLKSLHV